MPRRDRIRLWRWGGEREVPSVLNVLQVLKVLVPRARCKIRLLRVAAIGGAPASRRRRRPVTVFLGAEHDVGLFADRTRLGQISQRALALRVADLKVCAAYRFT
jgi:hypothetical protein